jgi:predicted component of type VI protein secretion system
LKKEIDGRNPYGENINYDSDFEMLKNEISKLGNLDYALIEKNALTILEKKSKDLRVFSFLSFVYLKNEIWEKYADVFECIVFLSESNFDKLYPDRQRAKELSLK